MRHRLKTLFVLLLVIALYSATLVILVRDIGISSESTVVEDIINELPVSDPPTPVVDQLTEQVEAELSAMSLEDKIAQLLVVQPNGASLLHPYGGVILMEPNYSTLSATRQLVRDLQATSSIPLIVTTDQEGGGVQRLRKITNRAATDIPSMLRVGNTGNLDYAHEIGRVLAEELRVIGINVDLAPTADIRTNLQNRVIGDRSFSSDPTMVAKMSVVLARGLRENGVMPTFKHFPGHGDTDVDSHQNLPVINKDYDTLYAEEFLPFRTAIADGAELIMVGHIALPSITQDQTPASLSHAIITDILREQLGFDGLVITDGLDMGALSNNYAEDEIYWRAVDAGADLLLLPKNPDRAISSIREHISEARIDESVRRILRFKFQYLIDYEYLDESYFGSAEHAAVVERIP